MSVPPKSCTPGMSGIFGRSSPPTAITQYLAVISLPPSVANRHKLFRSSNSARVMLVPNRNLSRRPYLRTIDSAYCCNSIPGANRRDQSPRCS
ncbi:Uncharacterised protein [Mycobacteroides abscessus subsp. abscessus]|nr:Uncharacterised protein [Mycobacteroides abscessus subsp. abscessus]